MCSSCIFPSCKILKAAVALFQAHVAIGVGEAERAASSQISQGWCKSSATPWQGTVVVVALAHLLDSASPIPLQGRVRMKAALAGTLNRCLPFWRVSWVPPIEEHQYSRKNAKLLRWHHYQNGGAPSAHIAIRVSNTSAAPYWSGKKD